jgi:serine/threonine-protein kinase
VAKKKQKRPKKRRDPPRIARPRVRTLHVAVALAFLNALWALFQWNELLVARTGGDAFCALASSDTCATVWDSGFARAVERWTFMPVAGWGVVWSLVALALPLWARARIARGKPGATYWSATLLNACMGVVSVPVLLIASLASGAICSDCVLTYLLVLAYGATCLRDLERPVARRLARGAPLAGGATLAAFLLLLYPGMQTPGALLAGSLGPPARLELPPQDAPRDRLLASFLRRQPTAGLQLLSEALAAYAGGSEKPMRPPRSLTGPVDAPVRITQFSDVLCSHCANLHDMLTALLSRLPPGSMAIDTRQFPLDGSCNPHVRVKASDPIRCTAAKAIICAEKQDRAFDFAGELFRSQLTLNEEKIYRLAERFVAREKLAACISDPVTEARLQDDIAWATSCGLEGTPLVLVNGRTAPAFPPFLHAILLAGGDANHPLFAYLPAAKSRKPRRRGLGPNRGSF